VCVRKAERVCSSVFSGRAFFFFFWFWWWLSYGGFAGVKNGEENKWVS